MNNTKAYFVERTNKVFEIRAPRQEYYEFEIYAEEGVYRAEGGGGGGN